jgi:hypothetical protein
MSEALDLFMASKKEVPDIRYVLPASKQEIFLRPFTTRDQKAILKALEKDDSVLLGEAFDEILRNCVTSKNFDPGRLISKDRECLLIKLRQESVKDEFAFTWGCDDCGKENTKKVNLEDVPYEDKVKDSDKSQEVTLDGYGITLILGLSTRDDEKKILKHARKNSGVGASRGDISQTEVLNAAYASVIKGLVKEGVKLVKGEDDVEKEVPTREPVVLSFDDRVKILESLGAQDKNKIQQFFDSLDEYGYDLNLGDVTCKHCQNTQEVEMDWVSFFIL